MNGINTHPCSRYTGYTIHTRHTCRILPPPVCLMSAGGGGGPRPGKLRPGGRRAFFGCSLCGDRQRGERGGRQRQVDASYRESATQKLGGQPWRSPNGSMANGAIRIKAGRSGRRKKWPSQVPSEGAMWRDGSHERRAGRTSGPHRPVREQTAPAGHFETFAKNASYMGGLREGWIEKHSNKKKRRRQEPTE